MLELRFFEVRGDPHIIERNHGNQLLPRLNVIANLDVLAHHARNGRDDGAVLQIEHRLIQRRFFLRHRSVRR